MEEQIYKIIRIDEDDFGCEGRPEGQEPMVRVVLEIGFADLCLAHHVSQYFIFSQSS